MLEGDVPGTEAVDFDVFGFFGAGDGEQRGGGVIWIGAFQECGGGIPGGRAEGEDLGVWVDELWLWWWLRVFVVRGAAEQAGEGEAAHGGKLIGEGSPIQSREGTSSLRGCENSWRRG